MPVVPNGSVHEVGLDDLFFSTTDRRGVIQQANEVFVRLSRHPHRELIGAPHNIIRHPDMPGGAFKLVWDALNAGEPTCAYVKNLAGDGSTYWAFATITPIDSGHLSVRARPARPDLLAAVENLYRTVRAQELAARESGASASEAAALGAQLIEDALRQQGFDSYAQFVQHVLPAEMTARAAQVPEIQRPAEAVGARRVMVDAVLDILMRIGALEVDLTSLQRESDELGDRVAHGVAIAGDLAAALAGARRTAESLTDRAEVVANAVPALTEMCDRIGVTMGTVLAHLDDMRAARTTLIYSIALAQIQAEVVVRFVVALLQQTENATLADRAIYTLTTALRDRLDGLTEALEKNIANAAQTQTEVEQAASAFDRAHRLVTNWCVLTERFGVSEQMADHIPDLEKGLSSGADELARVAQLAESIGQAAIGFDNDAVRTDLSRLLSCLRLVV